MQRGHLQDTVEAHPENNLDGRAGRETRRNPGDIRLRDNLHILDTGRLGTAALFHQLQSDNVLIVADSTETAPDHHGKPVIAVDEEHR